MQPMQQVVKKGIMQIMELVKHVHQMVKFVTLES